MNRTPFFMSAVFLAAVRPMPLAAQEPLPSALPEAELVDRLSRSLDSLTALDRFSGVVLLAKAGVPVFERAYGMADREVKRANDLETAFNLASINKMFTATAMRQLAAAGKVHLDSALGRYWPDYPNPALRRATIRQLLEHRSGVGGNIFAAPPGGSRLDLRHNRDFLPLFVHEPLQFEPGTSERYANAGYVVLGLLVERLSGEDYYDYVRRYIYEPAGMTRTAHYALDSLPPNTAIGYTRGGPGSSGKAPLRRNSGGLPGRGSAAGGGYSTARDLLRFLEATRAGRVTGAPAGEMVSAGGALGVNTVVAAEGLGGYDLIVLTNLDPPAAGGVLALVMGWLGRRVEVEGGPRRRIIRP